MNNNQPKAPIAKKVAYNHHYHHTDFLDNYYWLRNKENEEVIAYLNAENEYTNAILKDTEVLQEELFQEIKARIKEDDESVPVFEDGYFYYTRTEEGKQYPIHCRKKGDLSATEEILLNENHLAEKQAYFSLGEFTISTNNNLLAYSIDTEGNELYSIYVKNLTTGEILPHVIENTYYGLEWANDNEHLYYTKLDETHRPYQLWQHSIVKPTEDILQFEELDESFFLEVSKSKDDEFIILSLNSQITSEIHVKPAKDVTAAFQLIQAREIGVEYELEHYKGFFYILTNADSAKNFKLVQTPVERPSKANWVEVFPYDENHYLQGIEVFDNYIVIEERVNGLQCIRICSVDLSEQHIIKFNEPTYSVSVGENPEFNTNLLRLRYRSLIQPNTIYDYDMQTRKLIECKVQEVPSGYNKDLYVSERIFAIANDGAEIPISLVYKKDLRKPEGNPLYLYAYGSYGVNVDPYFSVAQLSLLNRGFVFAIANIRGSSSKGRQWYEQGKFLNKKNTFTDFITCAKHLIENNYTTADKMVANGGSAGGLLMGAVANMGAEYFNTIIADVPFVDVINTMMDESIPLTVIEYDEWGNPNDKTYFDYMLSYSPYDNIKKQNYPNILVTAGLNDPRVQYWEPAKYVAKLRELKTDNNYLLLKTNMTAGHSGVSGRFEKIKETALEYAFILKTLAIE